MNQIYVHPKRKTKVVFVQLGSPSEPTTKALRKYLRNFLGDPRVVDINPWLWKIILNFFVLPFRPKKSAKLYARIWDGESFPLITNTRDFTNNLVAPTPFFKSFSQLSYTSFTYGGDNRKA